MDRQRLNFLVMVGVLLCCAVSWGVEVGSPDSRVVLQVEEAGGKVGYRVMYRGKEMLGRSEVGVKLADGKVLGEGTKIGEVKRREVVEEFTQVSGKRSHVKIVSNEATIELADGEMKWELIVRVSDEGVGFRYRLEGDAGEAVAIAGERTSFGVPAGAVVTRMPLASFTTSHERLYDRGLAREIGAGLMDVPLLVEVGGVGCCAITEAELTDYAGMCLTRGEGAGDAVSLEARLCPLPGEKGVAVRGKYPLVTPWRVILVGDWPGKLIESDFILALNEPCRIQDVSWIRPGKTTFPWWNGFVEPGVRFEVGLNTETMNHYIDFCAEFGIPYHTLDGKNDLAWYGGPIAWKGADPATAVEGLDLQAVLKHAKEKGVKIRVWMHWKAAEAHMDRVFPLYHHWGISGVMLDFMDRDDQEMNAFKRRVLELCAKNELTVVFHGVAKPTGLERTWPNLLSHEAVMNLEYDKWEAKGVPVDHEMTVVFTRMLAGPMDFHQGCVRMVRIADFKPKWEAPVVMGTACRTIASYVVIQNQLPMMADYPAAYREHAEACRAMAQIPCTWDDTKVLAGEVGKYIVVARRAGKTWWIGGMTNQEGREVKISLSFIGKGGHEAEVWEDGEGGALRHRSQKVTDEVVVRMGEAGGWVGRIEE